jgi:threonyl-tRNA synthetase
MKYDLETLRHSCAHLMAQAIQELFPKENVKLGIGPVIDNGFYYDIDMETRLTEEHFKQIEEKMKEIIKEDLPVERVELTRDEADKFFGSIGQTLKQELIRDFPEGEVITSFSNGGKDRFVDLCRGPHVETTKHIPPFFKLLHTAGAYWRGR